MDIYDQNTTAWLSTTGSQIFFMQLGFLCYEVGFVKTVWTQSVILKNIEDTFVGILTFLAFGYTLSDSEVSWKGIISIPVNPLLIGVDVKKHDQILISAFFASTCATIISGAVLERMKNKAYILWCLLIILVNYSFVAHWVWHPDGWLSKQGFVDGAGSVVVHSTAGMAAAVAIWKLGPRRESIESDYDPNRSADKVIDKKGRLPPVEHAARPIINAMGAFFLWYGWFAFNVSSPIAFSKGIGDAIGTTALVTVISPICASCSAFFWMWCGFVKLSFESLLSCLLCGLVAITGMCHTCNVWEAAIIGFGSAIVYFGSAHFVRYKLGLDDPLQVISIHLFSGVYSGIMEGVVANNVYGYPGPIHGGLKGFRHLGIQLGGVCFILVFNFVLSYVLWELILAKLFFKGTHNIRVSILDIYLGTRLFDQNYDMALDEVLNCSSNPGKKMLLQFHTYCEDRYASEQLDFLLVVKIYNHYLEYINKQKPDQYLTAKYILRIIDTYVSNKGTMCINISGTKRSILMKIKTQLLHELQSDKKDKGKDKDKVRLASSVRPKKDSVVEGDEKEQDYKKLEGIWKDTTTPNMTPTPDVANRTPTPVANNDKSLSIISYQPGYYKSGMDITKEKIFNAVYTSVWKVVIPHFTQFLRHSYKMDTKTKFEVKIPFKLEKDWIITWDSDLEKDNSDYKLANTIPSYNNSGTLLSKMIESEIKMGDEKRNSGIRKIQLVDMDKKTDVDKADEHPIVFIDPNRDPNKKADETNKKDIAVIIE